jgi:hypothetical protein
MKYILLVSAFFFIGILAVMGYYFYNKETKRQNTDTFHSPIPEKTDNFSIANAPSKTKKGIITSLSGDVLWESRTATQPATLSNPREILQGEKLITQKSGDILLRFDEIGTIHIFPDSDLSIVQTLPTHNVFEQTYGTIAYTNTQNTSLSVRILHMLITATEATMTIEVKEETHEIIISMEKGNAKLAFNDINNTSTIVNLTQDDQYIYNDDDRTGVIK